MHFWRTSKLVAELRADALTPVDYLRYFVTTITLNLAASYGAILAPHPDSATVAVEAAATVAILVLALLAAYRANGGAAGTRFIEKVVVIGLPLSVKSLLAGMVLGAVAFGLSLAEVRDCLIERGSAGAAIAIQGIIAWRLVGHVRASRPEVVA